MMLFGPGDFSHLSVPERHTLIKVDINDDGRTNLPESRMCKGNTIIQQGKKHMCYQSVMHRRQLVQKKSKEDFMCQVKPYFLDIGLRC